MPAIKSAGEAEPDVPMSPTPGPSSEHNDRECDVCLHPTSSRASPYIIETPESSPERDQGGVRLSPAKPSLDASILRTTYLPELSIEQVHHHDNEYEEPERPRSLSESESQSIYSHELSPPDRSGLRQRWSTDSIRRRRPLRLANGLFPNASRGIENERPNPLQHNALDGRALDGPILSSNSTEQESYPQPSAARDTTEPIEYPPVREPPAYQPRALNVRPSRRENLYRRLRIRNMPQRIYQWFRIVAFDIGFMIFFLAVTGIILRWGGLWHWKQRLFPMTFDPYTETWLGPVEFSYPQHDFYLGISTTTVMIPLIPLAVIFLTQLWVRSWLDLNAALFAMKKAMVMMLFIQIILKSYIGEFRPFFISQCNPDPAQLDALRRSLGPGMHTPNSPRVFANPTMCRGDPTKSADENHVNLIFSMTSFPSGHTSESFMAGTFLALYLNAKLKPFADFHTNFLKMVVVMAPVIGAMFIAGSLVVDRNHHHHDIILSIPLGVIVALLSYRTHYASIFDYRTNHLPLPWSGTHESLNPTPPEEPSDHQEGQGARGRTIREKGNFTTTAWPRKPLTYYCANRRQPNARVSTMQGLDGTLDGIAPAIVAAGGRTYRPRFGVVKRAKVRMGMGMFQRGENDRISPMARRSRAENTSGRDAFEMRSAGGPVEASGGLMSRRTGVDDWALGTMRMRTPRPSDMV